MKLPQHDEDDADEGEGFTYSSGASIPQVARGMESSGADVVFDGDEEVARNDEGGSGEVVPYAHRDIKPAYVFLYFTWLAEGLLLMSVLISGADDEQEYHDR